MIITDLVQSQCSIRKQEIRKLQQKKRKIYAARILQISNGLIIGVWLIEQHLMWSENIYTKTIKSHYTI